MVTITVLDIPATFAVLLGRPWFHPLGGVSSTLHRKIKFPFNDKIVTICAQVEWDVALIGEAEENFPLTGFQIAVLEVGNKGEQMMEKLGYTRGKGLGKYGQGITVPLSIDQMVGKRAGLGYIGNQKALNDIQEPKTEEGLERKFFTPAAYDNFQVGNRTYPGLKVFMTDHQSTTVYQDQEPEANFEISDATPSWEKLIQGFEDLLGIGVEDVQATSLGPAKEKTEEALIEEIIVQACQEVVEKLADVVVTEEIAPEPKAIEEAEPTEGALVISETELIKPEVRDVKDCIDQLFEDELSNDMFFPFDDNVTENNCDGLPLLFNNINMNFAYLCDLFHNDSLHFNDHSMHVFDIDASHHFEFNLSTIDNPRNVKIGLDLKTEVIGELKACLKEHEEAFAWGYEDMPGINRTIAEHYIATFPGQKPIKQKRRRIRPEWAEKIKAEISKQLEAGFLEVGHYPEWLANIVPVPKKDGRVRMCVDYRDLNKASPKDDFPLPHIDVLIDSAAGMGCYSIMHGFSGYNQIKMAVEDREKTAFITEFGTFCYKVMPFGLKNAGAMYQRMATTLFHDMIHKDLEVYIDDMVIMTNTPEEHVAALDRLMESIIKYNLRMNPNKCEFGVSSGKLLGFVVGPKGIEIDPDKIKAIQDIKPPETEKQVRSFIGKIQYISRFISKLSITCEPIFRLLKKNQPTEWNSECQEAFEKIKDYLIHPLVLSQPKPGNPLTLYLSVEDLGVGAMLAQADKSGVENAIYYISKKLLPAEVKYNLIEKTCLAVVWAVRKLQHYFKSYKVTIVSKMDPMQYLYKTPTLAGKLSRWLILMLEFDIEFVTRKTVKGRAVAEFLAENPVEETDEWEFSFPDEHLMNVESETWKLFFDGSANRYGAGAEVVLETPNGEVITICKNLMFPVTNNMAEHEACILGLESLIAAGAKVVEVVGDSMLVIE